MKYFKCENTHCIRGQKIEENFLLRYNFPTPDNPERIVYKCPYDRGAVKEITNADVLEQVDNPDLKSGG
jgi:hypothetical protein